MWRHTMTSLGLYNEPRCEEALCSIYKPLYYWQGNFGGWLPRKTMKKERWVFLCLAAPINPLPFWNMIYFFFSPMCNPIACFTSIITKQSNMGSVTRSASRNAEPICLETPQVLVTALKHQGYCVKNIVSATKRSNTGEHSWMLSEV